MKTSFPPISSKESRILILGTMPGEMSLRLQQYYGHAGNHFWKIMFNILDKPFSKDYDKRKNLLLDNNIALWDVLQNCEGIGSSDSAIQNEVPNDFLSFYKTHKNINKVFFASQKAEEFYNKYIRKSNDIMYHLLPSPSSANTWKTFDQKIEEWKILVSCTR